MRMVRPSDLNLTLTVPDHDVALEKFLTRSGTFKVGDLLVNKYGTKIVPKEDQQEEVPPIRASDNQLHLADMDTISVIGKGSSGFVQLVQHKWTSQFFALKVIQMHIQEDWNQISRELKINQSSQCPYVVVCYQSFYDNGLISIVLEYMDGGSLADFRRKVKSIPEQYLSAISKQVLKGLVYLHHEKHIIHRDLKPSNILINHRGEVKITDFGVSVILDKTSGQQDTFVGTYNYMSPERICGPAHGHLSDIWSLGLLLLECATGKFPYDFRELEKGYDGFYELLDAVVNQPAPSAPTDLFSWEFCSFISACLQKEPTKRQPAPLLLVSNLLLQHVPDQRKKGKKWFLRCISLPVLVCFLKQEHPFIKRYDDRNIDLASYFTRWGSSLEHSNKEICS